MRDATAPGSQDRDARPCPRCGAPSLRIVYGLPDAELERAARRGEVVLGGCGIDGTEPTRQCPRCGHEWRHAPGAAGGPTPG